MWDLVLNTTGYSRRVLKATWLIDYNVCSLVNSHLFIHRKWQGDTLLLGLLQFLANVNLLSPVLLSSVTFVRPTQAVEIFGNISSYGITQIVAGEPLRHGS